MTAPHVELGAWGEHLVARLLAQAGQVEPGQHGDLRFEGAVEIEVKAARPSRADRDRKRPRYQFCLRRDGHTNLDDVDAVVLVLYPEATCYVIPAAELPSQRVVKIGPRDSRLADYRERWELLAEILEEKHALRS